MKGTDGINQVLRIVGISDVIVDGVIVQGGRALQTGEGGCIPGRCGAGIYIAQASNVVLRDVVLEGNDVELSGGAIFAVGSDIQASNLRFLSNSATSSGSQGGGISLINSTFSVDGATFTGNEAQMGGAVYCRRTIQASAADVVMRNVWFEGNKATESSGAVLYLDGCSAEIVNSVMIHNNSKEYGAVHVIGSPPLRLRNITMVRNATDQAPASISATGANPNVSVFNSIIWGNFPGDAGEWNFAYFSILEEVRVLGVPVAPPCITRCFDSDPEFVDIENDDLTLRPDSPAIDEGDPMTDPAHYPVNADGVAIDLAGQPRFQNGRIDIGAYEFQP